MAKKFPGQKSLVFPGIGVLALATVLPLVPPACAEEMRAENYDMRLERGVDLHAQGKYSEASIYFENLTRSNPERKEAFLWLGSADVKLKKTMAARDAFKHYAALAPRDVDGLIGVAETYETESNRDMAILWYKKGLDIDPNNERIRNALARMEGGAPNGASGFWHQGIFGLLGARTVWWGQVLAVFLYVTGIIQTVTVQIPKLKEMYPLVPNGFWGVNALLATPFGYIVSWGIPDNPASWGLLVVCTLIVVVGVSGDA
jgi:tetratricopeptide (TPR) repeat protein